MFILAQTTKHERKHGIVWSESPHKMGKKYQVLARCWSVKLLRLMFQELFFLKEKETWPSWVQPYTGITENSSYKWMPCKNIQGKTVRDLWRQAQTPAMTKKPPAFVPVKDKFKRFTYIQNMTWTFDSQAAGSAQPSPARPLWQWPTEAAQGRTHQLCSYSWCFPRIPSQHPEITRAFFQPERLSLYFITTYQYLPINISNYFPNQIQ